MHGAKLKFNKPYRYDVMTYEESIDTDRMKRRCESDDCVWRGGATARADRDVPACRATRGERGAADAAAPELRCPPRPAPRVRQLRSARTSAPLPPPHAGRRYVRPLRRLRYHATRHEPRDPHARSQSACLRDSFTPLPAYKQRHPSVARMSLTHRLCLYCVTLLFSISCTKILLPNGRNIKICVSHKFFKSYFSRFGFQINFKISNPRRKKTDSL